MEVIVAFITQVISLIPTVIADAPTVISLINGARQALTAISSSNPDVVTTAEFTQLDTTVAALEAQWAEAAADPGTDTTG